MAIVVVILLFNAVLTLAYWGISRRYELEAGVSDYGSGHHFDRAATGDPLPKGADEAMAAPGSQSGSLCSPSRYRPMFPRC